MDNENNITVIGIGRLGLGFALLLEKAGYNVLGVDVNESYVKSLNDKTFKTTEPLYEEYINNSNNLKASSSLQEGLNFSNYIFILVPTPNGGGDRFYDHSILSNLLVKINNLNPKNKHFIIGCTVMPKYTDEVGNCLMEINNEKNNNTLSYNPEFVAQGEIMKGFLKPDIVLIGTHSEEVSKKLTEIYTKTSENTPKFCIMKPLESEIVKISLNGFVTTKLSFANMISDVCDTMGADKYTVLDSIGGDSRIGNRYFRPGYSFGGPCFPRDTRALKQVVEQANINSDLLKATTFYNEEHVNFQANQLLKKNKEIYVIKNVCFKEDNPVSIIEESAKLKIAKKLIEDGKKVIIKDNEDMIEEVKKEYGNVFIYEIKN